MSHNGSVSVLIPACNEQGNIGQVLGDVKGALSGSGMDFEIIVVDDGSSDGTAGAAEQERVRVLRNEYRMGYGASLKSGIREARGEFIAIIDADNTYPAGEFPRLIKEAQGYDMVVGARTGEKVHIPFIRRPAKCFLNRLSSFLSGVKIPDVNSGMRVVRKEIALSYMHLFPSGFSLTTTLTLAMTCDGYRIKYVPINYFSRSGKSKINALKDPFKFLFTVIRTILYFNPLKIFMPASIFIFLMAIAKLSHDIFVKHNIQDLSILLFISFFQILLLGMVADMIGRR
jgi:glycosyltransferase involved in cell wall biosynthesis